MTSLLDVTEMYITHSRTPVSGVKGEQTVYVKSSSIDTITVYLRSNFIDTNLLLLQLRSSMVIELKRSIVKHQPNHC
jgi:hypothetical protein